MNGFQSLLFKNKATSTEELFLKRAIVGGFMDSANFGFQRRSLGEHLWTECGSGQPLIFCPGMFGSFRNFGPIGQELSKNYRVIVPYLPMYDVPLKNCTVAYLGEYLGTFIDDLDLKKCILAGNSMGGGTILNYTFANPENVDKLILFASSGLSFIPMRGGAMKLKSFDYVKSLLSDIFFDSNKVTHEELTEIFNAFQNKPILLRCLSFTRSTKKNLFHDRLPKITQRTLVIWGENDKVTSPEIGREFHTLIPNSEFHLLAECGHVPPHEQPEKCLRIMQDFLSIN